MACIFTIAALWVMRKEMILATMYPFQFIIAGLTTLIALFACAELTHSPQKDTSPTRISPEWLTSIRPTLRISANHYSDLVADSQGNVYIGSFVKSETDHGDRIYVVKVDPNGEIVWEKDLNNSGRATAIAIDPQERIWITGNYMGGSMQWDDQRILSEFTSSPFIACLDRNGRCLQLISGIGNGVGYNIHIDASGRILCDGIFEKSMTFGEQSLTSPGEQNYLTLLDNSGTCIWIRGMGGYLHTTQNDGTGSFLLTGNFHDSLRICDQVLRTESSFDSDGFLLKIDLEGNCEWVRQFGTPGNRRYGYRTRESGVDLEITQRGEAIVATYLDDPSAPGQYQLALSRYSSKGESIGHYCLARYIQPAGSISVSIDNHENALVTFSARDSVAIGDKSQYFPGQTATMLIHTTPAGRIDTTLYGFGVRDNLFRESHILGNTLWLSGHFRDEFSFGTDTLRNSGEHELFLMKVTL